MTREIRPNAIIIPTGGTVRSVDGGYRSTSYEDGDSFGVLGGYARVEAASILGKMYPDTKIVPGGKGIRDQFVPSHAAVMESELVKLGIAPSRIIREENSTTTLNGMSEAESLSKKLGWSDIIIVTNEYHVPRLSAMWKTLKSSVRANIVVAEDVITSVRPEFEKEFGVVKQTPAYIKRLASEADGLAALHSGTYKTASIGDKKERLV